MTDHEVSGNASYKPDFDWEFRPHRTGWTVTIYMPDGSAFAAKTEIVRLG